jgi:thioredoxin reductase (NADPH)
MKKYLVIGLLGVGCIYAATSLLSHRFCDALNYGRGKHGAMVNSDNVFDSENIIDIAVIGSGPAGLMASVYGCRAGRHVVCFEGATPGGLLTTTSVVENWPGEKAILGPKIVDNMHAQAEELGAYFMRDVIKSIDFSSYPYRLETEEGLVVHALSVIIASGAEPKKLNIPGEEAFWKYGVTTCAVCDGRSYKDKNVVVIGGGDSAIEEAIQLTPYARSIAIMVRGNAMRASNAMQQRLTQYSSKISVRYNVSLQEIMGHEVLFGEDSVPAVTGILVRNNETGALTTEPIDGVFLAIGHEPNVQMFNNQIKLSETGHIALYERNQHTSVPGVFAAGDVSDNEYRQAGVAAGDGIKAALDADRFLVAHGYSPDVAMGLDDVRFYPVPEAPMHKLKSVETIENYNSLIKAGSGLVFVDFYTDDCASCQYMLPLLQWVAAHHAGAVSVYSVDIEKAASLAADLFVNKVPTLLIYKNGQLVDTIIHPLKRFELVNLVNKYV